MACGGARGPGPSPRDEQRRHPLERHRQHRRRGPAPEAMPQARAGLLLNISRLSTVVLAAPLLLIAAQGYSERYTGRAAILGTLAALLVGGLLFPDPSMPRGSLLGAFRSQRGLGGRLPDTNAPAKYVRAALSQRERTVHRGLDVSGEALCVAFQLRASGNSTRVRGEEPLGAWRGPGALLLCQRAFTR